MRLKNLSLLGGYWSLGYMYTSIKQVITATIKLLNLEVYEIMLTGQSNFTPEWQRNAEDIKV